MWAATAERSTGSGEGGLCLAAAVVRDNGVGTGVGTGDVLVGTNSFDGESAVGSEIPGVPEPPQAATASAKTTATGIQFILEAVTTLKGEADSGIMSNTFVAAPLALIAWSAHQWPICLSSTCSWFGVDCCVDDTPHTYGDPQSAFGLGP